MKAKNYGFDVRTERCVLLLDIMGFKDTIYREEHTIVADLMSEVSIIVNSLKAVNVESIEEGNEGDLDFAIPVLFSDSIIFFSKSGDDKSIMSTLFAAQWVWMRLLDAGIPVKGAMAYGICDVNFEESIFFGRPIVDAHLLSEELHCYACPIHHSLENRLRHMDERNGVRLYVTTANLPFKSGKVSHQCISSKLGEIADLAVSLRKNASGRVRRYVDNTLNLVPEITSEIVIEPDSPLGEFLEKTDTQ